MILLTGLFKAVTNPKCVKIIFFIFIFFIYFLVQRDVKLVWMSSLQYKQKIYLSFKPNAAKKKAPLFFKNILWGVFICHLYRTNRFNMLDPKEYKKRLQPQFCFVFLQGFIGDAFQNGKIWAWTPDEALQMQENMKKKKILQADHLCNPY